MSLPRPRIAILGAGPIGLEAALAAAAAGYPFTLYEAAPRVAGNVRTWGHVRLFTPWSMNVSPRMRRRLAAGRDAARDAAAAGPGAATPPDGAELPTGHELADRLLEPIARLPEVAPHFRLATTVLSVGREGLLKNE
jgi:2-polyprenyl-6-methoxyphenol hydroxylase-like FAD-dependent oxidoreductase